jgi:ATP adenylyltransferase
VNVLRFRDGFGFLENLLNRRNLRLNPIVNDLGSWLKNLWAPWRIEYLEGERKPDFLREAVEASNDAEHLVVYRRKTALLMMNRYPYAPGHLMVVPYRTISRLAQLTEGEKVELIDLASYAERLLEEIVKAQGFNVGWNVGTAAGAGVADHLHLHIVPRWNGDHNYITVLGGIRIIPVGLTPLYEKLRDATERIPFSTEP